MKRIKSPNMNRAFLWLSLFSALLLSQASVFAQKTQPQQPATETRPTIVTKDGLKTDEFPALVKPTSTVKALPPSAIKASPDIPKTDIVVPQEPTVGGRLGLLVESQNGSTKIRDIASNELFNPASNVKILTSLAAIKTFGLDYRFTTAVWTNGAFDSTTGTITGDLIITGRDPSFNYEQAIQIAQELNKQGIRTVTGNLIVPYGFTMNYDWSALRSGEQLYDTLDSERRPSGASQAWFTQRSAMGDSASLQNTPGVAVMGAVVVNSAPPDSRVILMHKSPKLVDILKPMLCYSNNFMAERIGETVGGANGVRKTLIEKYGISEYEISLASTSGLGVNRVTPRAMMQAYRYLKEELARHGHTPADILPVAGVDPGTLQRRFTTQASRASVIGKTGTLGRTDGGVSSLVGEMKTAKGEVLYFVIFNQRGSVSRFRYYQEELIAFIQNERGGPAPFMYVPQPWAIRMSDTKSTSTNKLGEFEGDYN